MNEAKPRSVAASIVGVITLGAGLAAFLVPLQHAGPYGIPGRGLVGGSGVRSKCYSQGGFACMLLH